MNFYLKKTEDQLVVWSGPDFWLYFRGFGLLALNLFISITLLLTTSNRLGALLISLCLTPFVLMIFYRMLLTPCRFTLNRNGTCSLKERLKTTEYNQPSEVWTNYEFRFGFGGSSTHTISIHAIIDGEEILLWSVEGGYFEREQGKHAAIDAALYDLGYHPPVTTVYNEKGNIGHIDEPVFNIDEKHLPQPLAKITGYPPLLLFGDLRDKKFGIWFYLTTIFTVFLFTPWVTQLITPAVAIVIGIPFIAGLIWRFYKWANVNIKTKQGKWEYGIICTQTHFIDRPGHTLTIIPRKCMKHFRARAHPKNPYCISGKITYDGVHGIQTYELENNIVFDTKADEIEEKIKKWIGSTI